MNDDDGINSGSAYIFARSGSNWTQQAKLTASDGATDDEFGKSVSISGDYAIVGAWWDDDNDYGSGSAYIFKKPVEGWSNMTETTKLTASDGAGMDEFGVSVSISGAYAIVGAHTGDIVYGDDRGSAYIFYRNEGGADNWGQQAKLSPSDGAAYDNFGKSVSISGDYAIGGAIDNDPSGISNAGAAYIFVRNGTVWTQQQKLTASDGEEDDNFGSSVSIFGDYVIVGAYQDDDNGSNSGSAYAFLRSGTSWTQTDKQTASDGDWGDRFGNFVSISGNYAIVAAFCDEDNGGYAGAAYIYHSIEDLSLPVELSTFNAVYSVNDLGNKYITIKWATASETDVIGFNIYRNTNNSFIDADIINIEPIQGHGTTTVMHTYSFNDEEADVYASYYYWLEVINLGGTNDVYGPIKYKSIDVDNNGELNIITSNLNSCYPNPARSGSEIKFDFRVGGLEGTTKHVELKIYNVLGELVVEIINRDMLVNIYDDISWIPKNLPCGMYFYQLNTDNFNEVKKMVIVR